MKFSAGLLLPLAMWVLSSPAIAQQPPPFGALLKQLEDAAKALQQGTSPTPTPPLGSSAFPAPTPAGDVYSLYPSRKPLGTVASADEVCSIFEHPIFRRKGVRWDPSNLSVKWIRDLTKQNRIELFNGQWIPNGPADASVENSVADCLRSIAARSGGLFANIKATFPSYLNPECVEQRTRMDQSVGRDGRLQRTQTPLPRARCADFTGRVDNTPASTSAFLVMLTLREGHAALRTILDNAEEKAATDEIGERKRAEEKARVDRARADSERASRMVLEAQERRDPNSYENYSKREKSLLEKIANYSSFAAEEGTSTDYWISGANGADKCVLTRRSINPFSGSWGIDKNVDLTKLNEKGFRIKKNHVQNIFGGWFWQWSAGDEKQAITGADKGQILERLQRAWGLAFQQCPGMKSEF